MTPPNNPQEQRLDAEHQKQIPLAVSLRLEHRDFEEAPSQQHLHRVDDAHPANEQRQQPNDAQKRLNAAYLRVRLLLRLRYGCDTQQRILPPNMSCYVVGGCVGVSGHIHEHPGIRCGRAGETGEAGVRL